MEDKRTEKRKTGDLGEKLCVHFLKKHGFKVLDRNYLKPWGEIDIVTIKDNCLHFIEVKTVNKSKPEWGSSNGYEAEDNVHEWKLKRLGRTIETYLLEKNIPENQEYQLDVAVVYLDIEAGEGKVRFIPDVG